jgi:hypothetical protein
MPITINCASCSIRLTLGDDRAGQQIECPKCEAVVKVPHGAQPTSDQSRPPLPSPPTSQQTRSHPSSQRRYKLVLIAFVLLVTSLVGIWLIVGRADRPNTASRELRHADLSELVLELNKLPDVEVTSIFNFKTTLTDGILPPDREYPTVWLAITDKRTPGQKYLIHVTDCTSIDRADLVRNRHKERFDAINAASKMPGGYRDDLGDTICSSGRFLVVGHEPAIAWLRRHYKIN